MEALAWLSLIVAVAVLWYRFGSEFLDLVDPIHRVPVETDGVGEFHWRTVQIQEGVDDGSA